MTTKGEIMGKIFTEEGEKLIEALVESYTKLMITMKVPFKCPILGFPMLQINNREELFERLAMLGDLMEYHKREVKA